MERLLNKIGREEGCRAVTVLNRLADGFAAVIEDTQTGEIK